MRPFALLLLLAAASDEQATVELSAKAPEGRVRIGYGWPRPLAVETTVPRFVAVIPAFRAKDPVFGRISLGGSRDAIFWALDRSEGGTHHDRLYVDSNRDLDLTNDGEPLVAELRNTASGDKAVEFPAFDLPIGYTIEGATAREAYRGAIFFEGGGDRPPTRVYFERDGWREGVAKIDGAEYRVAVVDDDNDGIYTTNDSWTLQPADAAREGMLAESRTREIGYPCWIPGGKRIVEVATLDRAGRSAALRVADAKETEREYFVRVAAKSQTPEERELQIDPLRPKARDDQQTAWIAAVKAIIR